MLQPAKHHCVARVHTLCQRWSNTSNRITFAEIFSEITTKNLQTSHCFLFLLYFAVRWAPQQPRTRAQSRMMFLLSQSLSHSHIDRLCHGAQHRAFRNYISSRVTGWHSFVQENVKALALRLNYLILVHQSSSLIWHILQTRYPSCASSSFAALESIPQNLSCDIYSAEELSSCLLVHS
jgi:hypothetical protein